MIYICLSANTIEIYNAFCALQNYLNPLLKSYQKTILKISELNKVLIFYILKTKIARAVFFGFTLWKNLSPLYLKHLYAQLTNQAP